MAGGLRETSRVQGPTGAMFGGNVQQVRDTETMERYASDIFGRWMHSTNICCISFHLCCIALALEFEHFRVNRCEQ